MFVATGMCRLEGPRARLRVAGLLLVCAMVPALVAKAETAPKPVLRVPLSELGFPGYAVSMLHAGASMATVHMLDSSHLLFTYSLRSLVPRLPGDDANDSDRQVAAVLVEVPSGKILARTKWHLHDHGRYLWNMGRGLFVLRSGNDLSVLAPLLALASGDDAFTRFALPHQPGQPVSLASSPDGKMITVELESKRQAALGDEDPEGERARKHYIIEFYRLARGTAGKYPVSISGAGLVGSPVLLSLALDGDGYLWAEDNQRGKWTVSFNEFGGKQEKLTPVMSSCRPRMSLLSRSQFLVETCRGSDQQPTLAAYGFDGHENWEEQLGESQQPPTLALAPDTGRFALSRLAASSAGAPVNGLGTTETLAQEIRVYQTESGDMLLHVLCAPVVRSAENFDLSPDGGTLAVLGTETLDLYHLPELTARDRKDLAEVQTMTPPEGNGPVLLGRLTRPVREAQGVEAREDTKPATVPSVAATAAATAGEAPGPRSAPPSPTAGGDPTAAAGGTVAAAGTVGDVGTTGPRKPPTLLNPGEHAEFKAKPTTPQ